MQKSKERHPFLSYTGVLFLLIAFLLVGGLMVALASATFESREAMGGPEGLTVILDAGHGGEDGGAVGVNGALEKELNLAIAKKIGILLEEQGVRVIYTRTEDTLLYGAAGDIPGHRKEYDLKNRLAVAEKNPGALFVSIHMNSFSVPKYSGLQVYYAETEGSRSLANAIQEKVCQTIQKENTRKTKAAGSHIYLLEHAVGRAVLVECGFLSNPEEAARLTREDYQGELSFSIFCGIMEYINSEEKKTT